MTDREQESRQSGERERAHEFLPPDPQSAPDDNETGVREVPLDPWLAGLVRDAMPVGDAEVPRELMWARIRQQRRSGVATTGEQVMAESVAASIVSPAASQAASQAASPVMLHRRFGVRPIVRQLLAVAATLAIGVAIGRYGMSNSRSNSAPVVPVAQRAARSAASPAAAVQGGATANDPAVVAMEEHLARTVALLVTVRDESPDAGPGADVSGWARELLGTTRMLLDEPQLRDDRTRRLLQDLELVLVQIVQARGTAAPEARRAPSETMRETNLLPRVRAVVTASSSTDESTFRGIAE
jgi:hypothetical protein